MEAPGSYVFGRFRGPSPYQRSRYDPAVFEFEKLAAYYFDRPLLDKISGERFDDAFD